MHQESKQAKWPSVVATITQQSVRRTYSRGSGGGYSWNIETEASYTVDGEELMSSIHSHPGSSDQEQNMYRWVSQHPPGTSLPIRYDPQHHDTVAPVPGDMPMSGSEVPGDLEGTLIFSVLSGTLLTIAHVVKPRQLKPVKSNTPETLCEPERKTE